MRTYTTIIAAAAMLQGAMAQDVTLAPDLDINDIARKVDGFGNACRQQSSGQIINGTTVPFPCNAEVQIKNRCDQMAKTVAEMKECLCRKNTDKKPSAFFEVAQACVSCNRCWRFQTTAGGDYFSQRFQRIEDKFCSPDNKQTYDEIVEAEGNEMPVTSEYDQNNCVTPKLKSVSIENYAKLEIQPWEAGGRFAKDAAPETPAGNGTTNGSKSADVEPVLKPVPVADEVIQMCATLTKKGGVAGSELGVSAKFGNGTANRGAKSTVTACMPFVRSGCTAVFGGCTCSKEELRTDLADFNPSDSAIKSSYNITFTSWIKEDTFPDCKPLENPENIEGTLLAGTNIVVPEFLVQILVSVTQSFNIQINIFQQCNICEEAAQKAKETPDQPKVAPAQPPAAPAPSTPKSGGDKPAAPAPLTPNKGTSAQPEEEDLSCEVEDQPAGGQGGSQPPININLEDKINISGPSTGPAGPAGPGAPRNDGVTPEVPSKGTAPGPEGDAPKKPMPSGLTPPGSPGNPMPSGVLTETTTTTTSRNGTSTLPGCKGPSCSAEAVVVNGAGAMRASSLVAAAAAVLVAAL